MNRRVVWILAALAALAAIALLAPLFFSQGARPAGPAGLIGEPAPAFALVDDRGGAVSLERYHGRVVVMNLWASWCPPCRAEMPDLQRIVDAYGASGVVVVGINQGESAERARAFAGALHIAFPIWLDPGQQYGRAFTALGLPTTVVIARDGSVVSAFDGALSYEQMRAAVAPLVAAR